MKLFLQRLVIASLLLIGTQALAQTKRSIDLELEPVEGATGYEIELNSKRTGATATFKMTEPRWQTNIRTGEYTMRLRSYDARGVPGAWSESSPFVVNLPSPKLLSPDKAALVKTNESKTFETPLSWELVDGTKYYKVDIVSETGETYSEKFDENSGKVKLPVAKTYTWTVVAYDKSGEPGEKQDAPGEFTLIGKALDAPEIEKPEDIYVSLVKWEKPENAVTFSYQLSRVDESERQPNQEQKPQRIKVAAENDVQLTQVNIPVEYPGGRYRLAVKAQGVKREPSKVAAIDFDVWKGNRSPANVEDAKLRASLEKPSPWYFVASYLITQLQYQGVNSEQGRNAAYSATGGTGRLGLGYIHPKLNRGFLGIIDLTGMTVAGTNVTYASAETHFVTRYTWGRNMLRPTGGLYYKELIESKDTQAAPDQFTHEKIAMYGVHGGFDFWRPFTSKIGLQLNARYYFPIDAKTPNGGEFQGTPSMQLGFMGSYKLKQNITGFMGWAHREDTAAYKSTPNALPTSKGNQEVTISGDYFNLLLEWGF